MAAQAAEQVTMAVIEDAEAAQRLAVAILNDITLYNDERIRKATDLEQDLAPEIEEGRVLFRERVAPALHKVFEDEILAWRGRAKDRAAALAPAKLDASRVLLLVGLAVGFVAVVAWLVLRRP